ncbi:hypothetical protein B0T18DRAFT_174594 [Schizothecium vesticola]|uniref:Uncharacterized protein n=1 Tax=Schizothecium vesticola TaxID=314040 RepID=A0AA40EPF1_9PEZI|nr:hypothetical protein B0T18DRAFT_174594 [Schizothecium vesticola]
MLCSSHGRTTPNLHRPYGRALAQITPSTPIVSILPIPHYLHHHYQPSPPRLHLRIPQHYTFLSASWCHAVCLPPKSQVSPSNALWYQTPFHVLLLSLLLRV